MCKCKWHQEAYKCDKDAWEKSEKEYCIFHEPNRDAKGVEQFWSELKEKWDGNFVGYHFPPGANFADPFGKADFLYANFHGDVDFSDVRFKEKVNFSNAIFKTKAIFIDAIFCQSAFFRDAEFHGDADFSSVELYKGGEVDFTDAKFKQEADFNSSKFYGTVVFNNATFNLSALFSDAILEQAKFRSITFPKDTDFQRVCLTNCAFYGSNIKEVNLTGAIWIEKITSNQVIPEERSRNYEEAKGVYRNIKNSYKAFGNYDMAANFYYREMECVRKHNYPLTRLLTLGFIWHVIILYLFCGYGEKHRRIVIGAAIIVFSFAALYYPNPWGWGFIELKGANWEHKVWSDAITAIHFSIVTFTTLGYGNIYPVNLPAKVATALEVIFGYVVFGALVALVVWKISRNF